MLKISPLFHDPRLRAVFARVESAPLPAEIQRPERHPLISPALLRAVERLRPHPARELINLIGTARFQEAAALAEQIIADADT